MNEPMRNANMTRTRYRRPVIPPIVTSKGFAELTTAELYELLRLRAEVFVVEQDCAYVDLDGRDTEPGTVHHWIADGGRMCAYLRALAEIDGSVRVGRVVTATDARGRGLAARLVEHVQAVATGPIVLDAQSHLTGWYEQFGFVIAGEEFLEDGIPHVPMRSR